MNKEPVKELLMVLPAQMAEMGRKIANDIKAANGAQASAEAQASAAADKAKLEHRLEQLSAEVIIPPPCALSVPGLKSRVTCC